MSQTPFFSVGIPVYNTAKWVGRCLDTVLSQSFTDFEVVCVDDGSTDDSLKILREYSRKDPRVKVFTRENGGSAASAKNAMIRLSSGRYLRSVDSDDEMCEDTLLNAYNAIVENNYPDILQAGFIKNHYGVVTNVLPDRPCLKEDFEKIEGRRLTKDEFAALMYLRDGTIGMVASKFIKREFLAMSGVAYNTKYYAREDGDLSYYLLRKADTIALGDFYCFIYWLPREGSVSTSRDAKTVASILRYYMDFYDDIANWNISPDILKRVREKQEEFFYITRSDLMQLFYKGYDQKTAFRIVEDTDRIMGEKIRHLPSKGEGLKNSVIYTLFRLIGIKSTMKMLYSYLRRRKVI